MTTQPEHKPLSTEQIAAWKEDFLCDDAFCGTCLNRYRERFPIALAALEQARELLIRLHTNHYEPLYGGYCWCHRPRLNGVPPHEANCLAIRAYLASVEEGK